MVLREKTLNLLSCLFLVYHFFSSYIQLFFLRVQVSNTIACLGRHLLVWVHSVSQPTERRNSDHFGGSRMRNKIFLHAQVKVKSFCTSSLLFIFCHVHLNTYLQENKIEIWKKEYRWYFAFTVQLLYLQYVQKKK